MDQEHLRSIIEPVQEAMAKNMGSLVSSAMSKINMKAFKPQMRINDFLPAVDLKDFMPKIPVLPRLPHLADMKALQRMFRQSAELAERSVEATVQGDETLEASGYGFADHMWNWSFVATFAHVDPRVRAAVVTRRMAILTSSETFEEWLAEEIEGSILLKRRWPIVRQALAAHRRREYVLSTPVLLARIEGVVGDALILKNRVVAKDGKLYRLDNNGNVMLGRNKRPVELRGLHPLVSLSDFSDHEALEDTASFITDSLAPWRNPILHGRNVQYGTAKLSVQALLVLWLLAIEVRAEEEGRPPSAPAEFRGFRTSSAYP